MFAFQSVNQFESYLLYLPVGQSVSESVSQLVSQ